MSINKVLSFLRKQGVLAISNNKRIDTELATSYLAILFESDKYSDQHVSNKDYFAKSVKNAFLYFDCNGFVYKIYTSLCYFFDELLSKEDYYLLADKLIHKISGTKHLSKYINMIAFAKNCKLDFDPSLIEFKKTEGMILKDEKSFLSSLKRDFHYKRIVLCYDQLPGVFIFDTTATFLDLDGEIYVYFFDVNGEAYQFDDEGIQVNKRKKTVTVSLPMRSNVIISNSPIVRRTVQKLDDKTAELERLAAEAGQKEHASDLIEKTAEIDLSNQQSEQQNAAEELNAQQEDLPETETDAIVEEGTTDDKQIVFQVELEEKDLIKPITSKEVRENPELLAKEKAGLKKAITSNFTSKFFFYPAIGTGRYKLSNAHLSTLDLTHGFCIKGFSLESFELLDDGVKILGRIADGTIVYEVAQDCHVVIFAGKDPQTR
jgi:hypothetical protein